jgi:hypothetical protein
MRISSKLTNLFLALFVDLHAFLTIGTYSGTHDGHTHDLIIQYILIYGHELIMRWTLRKQNFPDHNLKEYPKTLDAELHLSI